nr:MAG TPA: hypothetical protein [Caudoviricetes sp.]DAR25411.1 MAG TPA: hypothetical protein [Bacteriophage sp.]
MSTAILVTTYKNTGKQTTRQIATVSTDAKGC